MRLLLPTPEGPKTTDTRPRVRSSASRSPTRSLTDSGTGSYPHDATSPATSSTSGGASRSHLFRNTVTARQDARRSRDTSLH